MSKIRGTREETQDTIYNSNNINFCVCFIVSKEMRVRLYVTYATKVKTDRKSVVCDMQCYMND